MTTATSRGLKYGYRSGLEEKIAEQLRRAAIPVIYEQYTIPFNQPAKARKYTPDFVLPNGVIIESKGRFVLSDRQKHLMIKEQYPEYDIRFVFSNSKGKISKGSKTTYAMWCNKHGFKFADRLIPKAWLKEPIEENKMLKTRTKSQLECVLSYMRAGKTITPAKARELFDVNRLAAIISKLRVMGHDINSELEYDVNNKRYSKYSIA